MTRQLDYVFTCTFFKPSVTLGDDWAANNQAYVLYFGCGILMLLLVAKYKVSFEFNHLSTESYREFTEAVEVLKLVDQGSVATIFILLPSINASKTFRLSRCW